MRLSKRQRKARPLDATYEGLGNGRQQGHHETVYSTTATLTTFALKSCWGVCYAHLPRSRRTSRSRSGSRRGRELGTETPRRWAPRRARSCSSRGPRRPGGRPRYRCGFERPGRKKNDVCSSGCQETATITSTAC